MEANEVLSGAYAGILRVLNYTLDGLTREDLDWQPAPGNNSIGWLVWHLTRWQDVQISGFKEEEQLWVRDGWHARFNRPADPKDHGLGHKPEDVARFKSPDAATLLGYFTAVVERSQEYFKTLSAKDLDRTIEGTPFKPPPTLGMLLLGTHSDGLQHAGQASYIRGMRQGYGWH